MNRAKSEDRPSILSIIGLIILVATLFFIANRTYGYFEDFFFQFSWGQEDLCMMSIMSGEEAMEIGDPNAISKIASERQRIIDELDCPVYVPSSMAKNISMFSTLLAIGVLVLSVFSVTKIFSRRS